MKRIWIALIVMAVVSAGIAGSVELTSARLYKKQGELLKSLEFYDAELQKNPGNLEALYERGELLGDIASDTSKASLLREIAKDEPNPQRAVYARMLADFEQVKAGGDDKYVKKVSKKMDEQLTRFWHAAYMAAAKYDSAQAYDSALQVLQTAILLKPEDWHAYGLQAQIFEKMEQPDKAIQAWEDAHKHIDQGNFAKEKPEDYKQAIEVIHARLLEGYYDSGDYRKAIDFADQMIAADPANADAVQYKAFSQAQLASDTSLTEAQRDSMRREAVQALDAAQKSRPDYSPIIYTKGQFCLQLGDTACAMQEFTNYLELEPQDRDALLIVGVIYLEGGSFVNTKKACDTFKALTEYHPEDGAGWINYGIATIRLGDNENGRKYIEKGKQLSGG